MISTKLSAAWITDPVTERARYVGIYFLIDRNEIVYVGQSIDVEGRMLSHVARRSHPHPRYRIRWQSSFWIPVEESELLNYETTFIRLLKPRYNTRSGKDASRDIEFSERFGIPLPDPARITAFDRRRKEAYGGERRDDGRRDRWRQRARRDRLFVNLTALLAARAA